MPKHTILLDLSPKVFALTVVAGMALVGMSLGVLLDLVMGWFGLRISRTDRN